MCVTCHADFNDVAGEVGSGNQLRVVDVLQGPLVSPFDTDLGQLGRRHRVVLVLVVEEPEVVDARVLPHLNFQRMTAAAVGPGWRQTTPEQKNRLQEEFKILLVRTYSGALTQISDQTVIVKPLRGAATDTEVLVRSELKGRGDPIQLDYRLEKTPGQGAGWKIYNLNVMGIWLIDTYRSQFAEEINAKGIDGLINTLAERNRSNAKK